MNDYKRLVSYIYSYPGGVRDKNVGFAKAEVRGGQLKLVISLKGVYTDAAENFGVYFLVDKSEEIEGRYTLLPLGTILINNGMGQYSDLLNPDNINGTGYLVSDVCGLAIARQDDTFYMMFSLWEDGAVAAESVVFVDKSYRKQTDEAVLNESMSKEASANSDAGEEITGRELTDEASIMKDSVNECSTNDGLISGKSANDSLVNEEAANDSPSDTWVKETRHNAFETIYENQSIIDVFDDDYYYDCIEVTPEQIRRLPVSDEVIVNNSFLLHGFYNFRHILFGKVMENERHTSYFIGVPGMYCNRERFMASMFGFNNFKKSHRSDYSNPYFGYWYQEI